MERIQCCGFEKFRPWELLDSRRRSDGMDGNGHPNVRNDSCSKTSGDENQHLFVRALFFTLWFVKGSCPRHVMPGAGTGLFCRKFCQRLKRRRLMGWLLPVESCFVLLEVTKVDKSIREELRKLCLWVMQSYFCVVNLLSATQSASTVSLVEALLEL